MLPHAFLCDYLSVRQISRNEALTSFLLSVLEQTALENLEGYDRHYRIFVTKSCVAVSNRSDS